MNILLAGEGGQGVQSVAQIIAKAAEKSGKKISYLPGFGVEQRGGVSLAFLKLGDDVIHYPRFAKADIIVTFCDRAIEAIKEYLKEATLFIYDNSAIDNQNLEEIKSQIKNFIKIPAQKIAMEKYTIKSANMIMLGGIFTKLEVEQMLFEDQIREEFKAKTAKNPQIAQQNINAFREGMELAKASMDDFSGKQTEEFQTEFSDDKKTWKVFPEYCKGCGLCIVRCPVHAIHFGKNQGFLGNPLPEVDINKCEACLTCQHICPEGAIKVEKKNSQQVE